MMWLRQLASMLLSETTSISDSASAIRARTGAVPPISWPQIMKSPG